MDDKHITDQQIDQFILGRMNKKDAADLQEYLAKDAELSSEVSKRKKLAGGVKAYGRKQLKESLKAIHAEEIINTKAPVTTEAKTRSLRTYLAIAASILVLAVAGFWLLNQNTLSNPSELAEAYFENPSIAFAQRDTGDEQLLVIERLFKEKKYTEAIPLLETQFERLDPDPSDLLLAVGISKMKSDDPAGAIQYFNQIIESKDFNFSDEAKWYLALSHLQLDDTNAAKKVLEDLTQNKNVNHFDEAIKILEKIK